MEKMIMSDLKQESSLTQEVYIELHEQANG